jgi:uncharacterized membrane protein
MCKPTQQATTLSVIPTNAVSYATDIRPLMQKSCTPCHFPQHGFKKMLDTHEAAKANINEIIRRIQLSVMDEQFMPFKSKKLLLTAEEIKLFQEWVAGGLVQ